MKFNKSIFCILSILFISSCGKDNPTTPYINNGELTGIWRSDFDNGLFSINQNDKNININVCNNQSPFTLTKEGSQIGNFLQINNPSEMEFISPGLSGSKLRKISNASSFNSGFLKITSPQISNLETKSNVCAYREKDDIYNHISAPYLNGFLTLVLAVNNKTTGLVAIPYDASLFIESDELPAGNIDATSGTVTVTNYSIDKLEVSFAFIASNGFNYSGSVKVDI